MTTNRKVITISTGDLEALLRVASVQFHAGDWKKPDMFICLKQIRQSATGANRWRVDLLPYEAAWLKAQIPIGLQIDPNMRPWARDSIDHLNEAIEQSGAVLPPVPDDDTQPVAALDSDSEPGDDTPDYFGDPSPERPGDPLLIEDADEPAVYLLVKAGEYDDHPTVLHAFASRKEAHSTAATLNTFSSESFEIQEIPFTPAD